MLSKGYRNHRSGASRLALVMVLGVLAAQQPGAVRLGQEDIGSGADVAAQVSSANTPIAASIQQGSSEDAKNAYGRLPLRFEANHGQTDPQVKFVSRGSGYSLFLTSSEAVMAVGQPDEEGKSVSTDVVRLSMVGANLDAKAEGTERLAGVTNYLLGNDPQDWITGVPSYDGVRYRGVYPGIDVVYYGNDENRLEYDFIVAPGVDPGAITLAFGGQEGLGVDPGGDLVIATSAGQLRQHKPVAYQEVGGARRDVPAGYVLEGTDRVRLDLGDYDPGQPLVIDPVLTYSSYLGGSAGDDPAGVATDPSGSAYVVGSTTSVDFPTSEGASDASCGSDGDCDAGPPPRPNAAPVPPKPDAFVAKFSPDGSALEYATYFGGNADDQGLSIAVDPSGNAYVAGRTDSPDFPVSANAFDKTCGSDGACNSRRKDSDPTVNETKPDAFVTQLLPAGVPGYSTYIGGSGDDTRAGGVTYEASATSPLEPGDEAPSGSGRSEGQSQYSGDHPGPAVGVAVDADGMVHVAGATLSADFPTTADAYDLTCGTDGICNKTDITAWCPPKGYTLRGPKCPALYRFHPDVFLVKIDPNAAPSLAYSTYLGGSGGDVAHGVAVDGSSRAYLAGFSYSPPSPPDEGDEGKGNAFPTTDKSFQTTRPPGAPRDETEAPTNYDAARKVTAAFLARIDPGATADDPPALAYSTFVAGTASPGYTRALAVTLGPDQHAYLVGQTSARDLPTAAADGQAFQPGDPDVGQPDGFVARFDTTKTLDASRVYLSYLGGSGYDKAGAVAVDLAGRAYVTGDTLSLDLPTESPIQQPVDEDDSGCSPALNVPACRDGFVTVVEPDGASLTYSTYLRGTEYDPGGSGQDRGTAVAVWTDPAEVPHAYVVGQTETNDFPAVGAVQTINAGYADGFLAKISPVVPERPYLSGITPSRMNSSGVDIEGGTEVAITGTGLDGVSRVDFGSSPAPQLESRPDGSVTAEVPPGTGTVDVTVTTDKGTSPASSFARLTYFDGVWDMVWDNKDESLEPRYGHTATLLTGPDCGESCGKVLVVGGGTSAAMLYDPGTSAAWSATQDTPSAPARGHTATHLPDGTVLVVGGSSAYIYHPDPENGEANWEQVANPQHPRTYHTATLLDGDNCGDNCGKVLVVAGKADLKRSPQTAELYDPKAKTWELAAPLVDERQGGHTATLLAGDNCGENCGKVLVVGGRTGGNSFSSSASAELYDPAVGQGVWTERRSDVISRYSHTATLLPSGKVLVAGGIIGLGGQNDGPTAAVEIYDPSKPFAEAFTATGHMLNARSGHVAASLSDGRVLMVGGGGKLTGYSEQGRPPLAAAEVYDPRAEGGEGAWLEAASMTTPRGAGRIPGGHSATVLAGPACDAHCGKVFVFGGANESDPTQKYPSDVGGNWVATAEQYTPGPTISAVSPPTGPVGGGTTVKISGAGFVADRMATPGAVRFAGVPAQSFRVVSPTEIEAVSPPASEDVLADVTVVVSGLGLATSPTPFTYSGLPGRVLDLAAEALSGTEVKLTFTAPGTVGDVGSPAGKYLIKQSREPITEANFDKGQSLCPDTGGVCNFTPSKRGLPLTVSVGGLTPETRYYYALKAQDDAGNLGPMSNVADALTGIVTPGLVNDLAAKSVSGTEVELSFSAAGSNGVDPPPAGSYIIKQSSVPITGAQAFDEATSLCEGGLCRFQPEKVGDRLTLSVTGLVPGTEYHYALRARDEAGNLGPISNVASVTAVCATLSGLGAGQVAYPSGYSLVGLPGGARARSQSPLFGWFNQGAGDYSVSDPNQPMDAGRGYWAWFVCPQVVDLAGSHSQASVSFPLEASRASMVGNPSATSPAVVTGHDYAARWDPNLDNGKGGYRMSGYREPVTLRVGEGAWVISYQPTTINVSAG